MIERREGAGRGPGPCLQDLELGQRRLHHARRNVVPDLAAHQVEPALLAWGMGPGRQHSGDGAGCQAFGVVTPTRLREQSAGLTSANNDGVCTT